MLVTLEGVSETDSQLEVSTEEGVSHIKVQVVGKVPKELVLTGCPGECLCVLGTGRKKEYEQHGDKVTIRLRPDLWDEYGSGKLVVLWK
jgi:hypothetical protein